MSLGAEITSPVRLITLQIEIAIGYRVNIIKDLTRTMLSLDRIVYREGCALVEPPFSSRNLACLAFPFIMAKLLTLIKAVRIESEVLLR